MPSIPLQKRQAMMRSVCLTLFLASIAESSARGPTEYLPRGYRKMAASDTSAWNHEENGRRAPRKWARLEENGRGCGKMAMVPTATIPTAMVALHADRMPATPRTRTPKAHQEETPLRQVGASHRPCAQQTTASTGRRGGERDSMVPQTDPPGSAQLLHHALTGVAHTYPSCRDCWTHSTDRSISRLDGVAVSPARS